MFLGESLGNVAPGIRCGVGRDFSPAKISQPGGFEGARRSRLPFRVAGTSAKRIRSGPIRSAPQPRELGNWEKRIRAEVIARPSEGRRRTAGCCWTREGEAKAGGPRAYRIKDTIFSWAAFGHGGLIQSPNCCGCNIWGWGTGKGGIYIVASFFHRA